MMMMVYECAGYQVGRSYEVRVDSLAELDALMKKLESEHEWARVSYCGDGEIYVELD